MDASMKLVKLGTQKRNRCAGAAPVVIIIMMMTAEAGNAGDAKP